MPRTMARAGIKQVWVSDGTKADIDRLAAALSGETGEPVSRKDAVAVAVAEALARRRKKGGKR